MADLRRITVTFNLDNPKEYALYNLIMLKRDEVGAASRALMYYVGRGVACEDRVSDGVADYEDERVDGTKPPRPTIDNTVLTDVQDTVHRIEDTLGQSVYMNVLEALEAWFDQFEQHYVVPGQHNAVQSSVDDKSDEARNVINAIVDHAFNV